MSIRIDDPSAYGAQNAAKLRALMEVQDVPVDIRLVAGPAAPSDVPVDHEETVQAQTIRVLREHGYRVLETSVRSVKCKCPQCKASVRAYGGTGQTKGIPDLLVRSDRWTNFPTLWIGVEVKGAKTPLSPEQKELLAVGAIHVARTPAQALEIVARIDALLGA